MGGQGLQPQGLGGSENLGTSETETSTVESVGINDDVLQVYGETSGGTLASLTISDYADIGAAINDAVTKIRGADSRGLIQLPAGSFSFSTTIDSFQRGDYIRISGAAQRGTELDYTGSGDAIDISGDGSNPNSGSTVEHIDLEHFILTGNTNAGTGILIEDATGIAVSRVEIQTFNIGINIGRGPFGIQLVEARVEDIDSHCVSVADESGNNANAATNEINLERCTLSGGAQTFASAATSCLKVQDSREVNVVSGRISGGDDLVRVETGHGRKSNVTLFGTHAEGQGTNDLHVVKSAGGSSVEIRAYYFPDNNGPSVTIDSAAEGLVDDLRYIDRTPGGYVDAELAGSVSKALSIAESSANPFGVYVPEGTWSENIAIGVDGVKIRGAGRETAIIDGGSSDAITFGAVDDIEVENLSVKTTSGGGNSVRPFNDGGSAATATIRNVKIPESDDLGMRFVGATVRIVGCVFDSSSIDNDDLRIGTAGSSISDCDITNITLGSTDVSITGCDPYVAHGGGETVVDNGGTIAHGLDDTPVRYNVESRDAGEVAKVTGVDGTDLTVEVLTISDGSAGGTGNNVVWDAHVCER